MLILYAFVWAWFFLSLFFFCSYGSVVGVVGGAFLIWVSNWMGIKFEELSAKGEKVGEPSKELAAQLAAQQEDEEDTSCGYAEEGQDDSETMVPSISDKVGLEKNEV